MAGWWRRGAGGSGPEGRGWEHEQSPAMRREEVGDEGIREDAGRWRMQGVRHGVVAVVCWESGGEVGER